MNDKREIHADGLGGPIDQRDAAIKERDELRARVVLLERVADAARTCCDDGWCRRWDANLRRLDDVLSEAGK